MPRARTRIPGFLLDHAAPPTVSALTEFYREEFLKHHKCLQAQREYFSAQAIENAENALLKIIADLDRLSEEANARTPRRQAVERVRRRDRPLGLVGSQQGSLTVPVSSAQTRSRNTIVRAGVDAVSAPSCDRARARRSRGRRRADRPRPCTSSPSARRRRRWRRRSRASPHLAIRQAIAIGTHAHADLPPSVEWIESSHPFPDARSEAAGNRAMAIAQGVHSGEALVILLSGGASALDGVADRRHLARRQDRRRRG